MLNRINFNTRSCIFLIVLFVSIIKTPVYSQSEISCEYVNIFGTANDDFVRDLHFNPGTKTGVLTGKLNDKGFFAIFDISGNIIHSASYNSIIQFLKIIPIKNSNDYLLLANDNTSIQLYRINALGAIVWSKQYSNGTLRYPKICQGINNEFYLTSWYLTGGASDDILVFKIDQNGNIKWTKRFAEFDDQVSSIAYKSNGNVLIQGAVHNVGCDQFILELDSAGNVINQNRLLTSYHNWIFGSDMIIDDSNNDITIAGRAHVNGNDNIFIAKFNSSYNNIWSKVFTASGTINYISNITEDAAGSIYVGYRVYLSGNQLRNGVSKFSSQGDHLWTKYLTDMRLAYFFTYSTNLTEKLLVAGLSENANQSFGQYDAFLSLQDTSLNGCIDSIVQPSIVSNTWQIANWTPTQTSFTFTTTNINDSLIPPDYDFVSFCDTCFVVTVPPIDNSIWVNGNDTICSGDSVKLEANYVSTHSYQWLKYGNPIIGATNNYYYAKKVANYRVLINDVFGNSATSSPIKINKRPKPSASISALGPTTFCVGSEVMLLVNAGPGYSYQWKRAGQIIPGANSQTYDAYRKGNHVVVVSDLYGCKNTSNKIYINRFSRPAVSINIQGTIVICQGSSITLTAIPSGGTAPYTYQWKRYGSFINGANAQSYTASNNGTYKVFITDANACLNKSPAPTTINQIPCPERRANSALNVYPNPVKNISMLSFYSEESQNIRLYLFDAIGNKVKTVLDRHFQKGNQQVEFSSADLPSGIYFLSIDSENGKQYAKIVIE